MKILQLSHSDIKGGAARAAYRIQKALRQADVNSQMLVSYAHANDCMVQGPHSKWAKAVSLIRPRLTAPVRRLLGTDNPVIHSPAILPSSWPRRLNTSNADLVHMHWVQGEMLSIEDIGRIRKPMVWTLHDMWPFCGAEHYSDDARWREGYRCNNRPDHESGFDLNRWCWQRKRRHWRRPFQLVCPSHWLAGCVQRSALLAHWPVRVIPNPLPTDLYRPWPQALARQLFGLPAEGPLLLFGAIGGSRDPRKGWDLLAPALRQLAHTDPGLQAVVFGQSEPADQPRLGMPVHYVGTLHDDQSLALVYSAADVMVVPSRMDNLPQTATEAQSCGVPVVAFNATGLPDVVEHERTGYLATPYDPADLAYGISWVLECKSRHRNLSWASRERAVRTWNEAQISSQYAALYRMVLGDALAHKN